MPQRADLQALIDTRALTAHFQPIVQVRDGQVFAHEALIRTPPGCPWAGPDSLFAAARESGLTEVLETECIRLALQAWSRQRPAGKLFLNISAGTLCTVMAQRDLDAILSASRPGSLHPGNVVFELTEHEHVRDVDTLKTAVARLRRHGAALALDDFGDGRSSLRLWSELKPEVVKIDKYFTHQLPQHPEKLQVLRALVQISQTLGALLVAEGVETAEELRLVRDLGLACAQGWLLGRPHPLAVTAALPEAQAVIQSKALAVFPERRRTTQQRVAPSTLLDEVPPVSPHMTSDELLARFQAEPELRAVALVEDGRPIGLVDRQNLIDHFARPYYKELFGRKPCSLFANLTPRLLELHAGIDDMAAVLTSHDQRYLTEGLVITENGQYRGLASGERLVRSVTEARIEAARHANPLTLLPGNIPITQHIERLLQAGCEFVACYADLNHFKPFNDQYGYWRGDEMILMVARTITEQADPRRDFVGHVGGDDFIVLFQSDDWHERCERIVQLFNAGARELYDEEARAAGGHQAEDRHGVQRFHPLTTVSIGACRVIGHSALRAEDVANAAARAKRQAKRDGAPLSVMVLGG